jgi:glutaredoxin-like protein
MSLIPREEKEHIKEIFDSKLADPVTLLVFTTEGKGCEYCKETLQLVNELSSISDKIGVEVYNLEKDVDKAKEFRIDKVPAIALMGQKPYNVRFFGIPAGYEFSAFIDDIIDISRGTSRLSPASKSKLRAITKPVHIQVFVTPTCPYCPRAVRLAHQFAMENDRIIGDMVEAMEFPELANKYGVMSVPHIVINEDYEFVGAYPEPQFLQQILNALQK